MISISLFVELLRTRPLLLFWTMAVLQAMLWTLVPALFYASPPGQLPLVLALALWSRDKLAEDAAASSQPGLQMFGGTTLAWNCATPPEVDAAFATAAAAGAKLLHHPGKTDYGGYRGYFADPDGHVWEIVQAPGFAFTEDGRLILPD